MPILRPGLVFVHIPKCAGTSIEVAAGFGDRYPTLGIEPTNPAEDRNRLFGQGLEHLSIREILTAFADLFDEKPRTFTIVRGPVDRFVSHFVWRFYRFGRNPKPLAQLIAELRAFAAQVEAAAKKHPVFSDPHDGLFYTGSPDSLHPNDLFRHLVPQCAFVFDRGTCAVDEIYHMDDLDRVTEMLHREYGFPAILPKRMAGSFTADLRNAIPPDVEQLVRSLYACDEQLIRSIQSIR